MAALRLATGRPERASASNLLKSGTEISSSAIRGITSAGSPFSVTSPVGTAEAGSNVTMHTPSKGTARRRSRAESEREVAHAAAAVDEMDEVVAQAVHQCSR